MQVSTTHPPILLLVWFGLSIAIAVLGNFAFYLWLLQKGVRVRFAFAGTPGYLDFLYVQWCRENRVPARPVIAVRLLLFLNVIAAAAITIPLFPRE